MAFVEKLSQAIDQTVYNCPPISVSLPCYFYQMELLGKATPCGVLPHLTETAFQIGHYGVV